MPERASTPQERLLALGLAALAVDRLLTADELAEGLGLERRGIYGLRDSGQLIAYRIGKRAIRFAPSDVLALIEAGRDEEWSPS